MAMVNWMKIRTGEATMFAAHHKIDNLIATIDWNGQQIDGLPARSWALVTCVPSLNPFGWLCWKMDGNDMDAVVAGLEKAKR